MIFTLGLNHHSAPVSIRERVAFGVDKLPLALNSLHQVACEVAILSTCNRTELYCNADNPDQVVDWLCGFHQIAVEEIRPYLYTHDQRESVRHAFRVASGLDSMVIGEPQILGQMKDAVRAAERANTLGTQLHKLFQSAFSVAKDVRSSTAIGANIVSMAAAGVHLAERIFDSLADQHILFIGAGEMIELCAAHFCAQNPRGVTVANRTVERARKLADQYNGIAIRLDELGEYLPRHDVIVSCTASPLPIIGLGMAERAIRSRRHRPMFMIDLAVPRDIEPEIGELDDVFLYTVDDLAQVVESGMESRQQAVIEAENIVHQRVDEFIAWLDTRDTVPVICQIRDNAEQLRRVELEHAVKMLHKGLQAEQVLEQLSMRLTNKFLHAPSQALHNSQNETRHALLHAALELFHLKHGDTLPCGNNRS